MNYRSRKTLITTLASLAIAVITTTAQAQFAVTKLEADHSPATDDFNARKGRARLITILSPT